MKNYYYNFKSKYIKFFVVSILVIFTKLVLKKTIFKRRYVKFIFLSYNLYNQ